MACLCLRIMSILIVIAANACFEFLTCNLVSARSIYYILLLRKYKTTILYPFCIKVKIGGFSLYLCS